MSRIFCLIQEEILTSVSDAETPETITYPSRELIGVYSTERLANSTLSAIRRQRPFGGCYFIEVLILNELLYWVDE